MSSQRCVSAASWSLVSVVNAVTYTHDMTICVHTASILSRDFLPSSSNINDSLRICFGWLPLRKLTTNNQAIYRWRDRIQWGIRWEMLSLHSSILFLWLAAANLDSSWVMTAAPVHPSQLVAFSFVARWWSIPCSDRHHVSPTFQ